MRWFLRGIKHFIKHILSFWKRTNYSYVHKSAKLERSVVVFNPNNLIMEENTNIDEDSVVMNLRAKVVFKKNSGAAFGFTAVSGNHMSIVGLNLKQVDNKIKDKEDIYHETDKDIVVEEDVWIGSRVTLLQGVTVGRGGQIGSGSVVRTNTPPYSVVIGNPAKVVGFRFTPEEILEHEKLQYEEKDRLPIDLLQKNYEKYFLNRIKEIKQFTKI